MFENWERLKNLSEVLQHYLYDSLLSGFWLIYCLNHVEEQSTLIGTPQICERARQILGVIVSIPSFTYDLPREYRNFAVDIHL